MDIEESKLAELLKTLNKQEFERLEKFVYSPFFNTSEQMIQLYGLLKTDYPVFKTLSKAKIFSEFYPEEEYKDKKIRDLLSRMLELVQGYLAQLEFEKKVNVENTFVLNQFIERNLKKHYSSKLKDSEKNLRDQKIADEDRLYNEYIFAKLNTISCDIFGNIQYEEKLTEVLANEYEHFLNYVIYCVLHYTLTFSLRQHALKNEVNMEFADKVIEFLDKYPKDKYPVISIFRNILKLQKNESEEVTEEDKALYHSLIKQIEENTDTIKKEDLRYIFIYLVNYTRVKSISSNKYFKAEHYKMLKYSIENDLYPKQGKYFNDASYVIVASTAMINKDYKWAEEFIEKFKNEVKEDVRENAYTLNMANLNYRTGNYDAALKYLIRVSIDDIYYQLKVKNLQIKIHYELGNYEMCRSVIDSYRHFLGSTKQFPEFLRIRFINYVNFTSRMVNIWLGGDPKNIIEITKNIQEFPEEKVESKSWLLAQAAKIKY